MGASKIQRRWREFSLFKWASTEMIYFLLFWYQATSSTFPYPIMFWLILHDPVLTYPILSWRVVSFPILFYSTLVSTERFISNLFIIFLQFLKFPGPHIWYFNFSKAIEVTQSDVLKRGLNELLETLPGGGIVQVHTTLYFCNEWCGWCHLTVMLLLL